MSIVCLVEDPGGTKQAVNGKKQTKAGTYSLSEGNKISLEWGGGGKKGDRPEN